MSLSTKTRDRSTHRAHCRRQLKGGSRSFHAAAFLLPERIREPASALYAFCRMADDLIDGPCDSTAAVAELHRRIGAIYRQRPESHACDQAMARVVDEHGLPRALLHALLEGFQWDAQGRGYANLSEVLAYSARVAGTVGVMMALLMGVRERRLLARAADLGVAMQLTNIARDVGEDAALGRLYLPADWLESAGVDAREFLVRPRFSDALGKVVADLLAVADELYARADSGISKLPADCRPAMYAARLLYAGIGTRVAENGYDSVSSRAVVSAPRKLRILFGLPRALKLPTAAIGLPPLVETVFLVDEAARAVPSISRAGDHAFGGYERKLVWVLDLFDELHRRESGADRMVPAARRGGAR